MLVVPLQAVPNQTVSVHLGGQNCQIDIRQAAYGLFLNLRVDNVPVLLGVICENLNKIVRSTYLGFSGDLAWIDTQGASDPTYEEIGSRYFLGYFSNSELT